MRVTIWLRDDLTRHTDGRVVSHRKITGWDDTTSPVPLVAADRAWRVCSLDPENLDLEEQVWRANFDDVARGSRFSVGDIVVADGVGLRCEPAGFSVVDPPTG